jgi:hypothetical protein
MVKRRRTNDEGMTMHKRTIAGFFGVAMSIVIAVSGGSAIAQGSVAGHVDKLPARQMITKLHQHPLQLRVKVLGDYQHQVTYLQKKTCRGCTWHRVDRKLTNNRAKVLYPLDAPATGNWFYRVMTPARAHFRESYSQVARTFRI